MKSKEVREKYLSADRKRKILMTFKHESVKLTDLEWGINTRTFHEFNTAEGLMRAFNEKFMTSDLNSPKVVHEKLIQLKSMFDDMPSDGTDQIMSYTLDEFIPIVTFLKKSPVFFEKEKAGFDSIKDKVTKLSLSVEEEKETSDEEFIKTLVDMLRSNLSRFFDYLLGLFVSITHEMRLQQLQSTDRADLEERVQIEPMVTEEKDFLHISVDRGLSVTEIKI